MRIPLTELKRFGAEWTTLPELPNSPFSNDDFTELCRLIDQYDFVIVQRCYRLAVVRMIRAACDVLGKKMVFETDDDYFNLPPTNPCFPEMQAPGVIQGYTEILNMADMITVSTRELKDILYPFNKNIHVFGNNVETIPCGERGNPIRAHSRETTDKDGKVVIPNQFGLFSCPSYAEIPQTKEKVKTVRIGYTGTPSHHEDFGTIHHHLERFMEKYHTKVWLIFIGDPWFRHKMTKGQGRMLHIPVSQYNLYMYHLRNLDIGLAPLCPNVFNMSKTPLKMIEYGSWGIPGVLPHYITYTREFTNHLNCLTYYNGREFYECLEELTFNHQLREELGRNARDYVAQNRVEKFHAQERYDAYRNLLASSAAVKSFVPQQPVAEVSK